MDARAMFELEADERARDELATQIRHASKDIHGYKDHYDLRGKSIEELEDILYDLANSPEQKYMDDEARIEMEDKMGYDSELSRSEMAPRRQGMRRRPAGRKSQRRMESTMKISDKELLSLIREAEGDAKDAKTPQSSFDPAAVKSGVNIPADVKKVVDPDNSPQRFAALDAQLDASDNEKKQALAVLAYMFDYGDNDPMKIEKIYARVRAGFKPMLAAVQKGAADSVKSDSDEKKSEKITFEGIRRLVREAVEDDVEDFNLRSEIRSAKDDGAQEGENKDVLDAITND